MKVFIWHIDFETIIVVAENLKEAIDTYYLQGKVGADKHIESEEPEIIDSFPCLIT